MHNPRKIVKVSPVLFTSVSQTFDDFCRQKCFTSPCLAKNKQDCMAAIFYIYFKYFIDKSIGLDNRLCLYTNPLQQQDLVSSGNK
jgi:hypothetical protein